MNGVVGGAVFLVPSAAGSKLTNDRGADNFPLTLTASFPMEFHFVHYNSRYNNLSDALASNRLDAVAVFGVFIEINDDIRGAHHACIRDFLPTFSHVDHVHEIDVLTGDIHDLRCLLPRNLQKFYRYEGSLTSGQHQEELIWTVFEDPIHITTAEAEHFYHIHGQNGDLICENNRGLQPKNGRLVLRNTPCAIHEIPDGNSLWWWKFLPNQMKKIILRSHYWEKKSRQKKSKRNYDSDEY
ncbi:unnamed protein product [Cyprideis torosa]|uniref:carbonic anhydrase n=1 Tax=Cyprideis torosa TaxID=163714 RepID=A0A7R8WQ97_9CRUS|nr:unnamed protein product [Cyprideis torosa]CAG0902686.1 unnamed protein product [Cyprideis torosa]